MIIRKFKKLLYKIGYFMIMNFSPKVPFNQDQTSATRKEYLLLWEEAKKVKSENINNFELNKNFKINLDWYHNLALHTQVVKKKSKINYMHGRLLYSTLRDYIKKKSVQKQKPFLRILETGTARGFSSLCMAKALNDAECSGNIITLDIIPNELKIFWNCIDDHEEKKTRLELLNTWHDLVDKYITFVEGDSRNELSKISFSRINFAFLDGSHTYKDVMNEFNFIKNKQIKGDIIFFDDYNKSQFPGIIKAVDKICLHYGYHKEEVYSDTNRGYVIATKN